jgi:hypothetical protein
MIQLNGKDKASADPMAQGKGSPKHRVLDVLLTLHHGTLNQHQLDTFFLVCLLRVNASTCFGHYSPIFRRLCTDAIWCNYML